MSTTSFQLQRVLPPLSSLMGLLALSGGIYGVVNPQAWSGTLGIPVSTPTSPALPFLQFVAARNISTGLTVLTLLYKGERKTVGTLFLCGVVTALTDAWICFKYNAPGGKAAQHAAMAVVVGLLGAGMYWA